MKASVMYEHKKFEYKEIEEHKLGENDVRIKVHSCGICGSDIHKMQTDRKSVV